MKLITALCLLLLTACTPSYQSQVYEAPGSNIWVYDDMDAGVRCYRYGGISCVKVK